MKKFFIQIALCLFFISFIVLTSCGGDDDNTTQGNGNLQLVYENGFKGLGPIVLDQTTQTSSNNQKQQFSTLKYIISNVVLTKTDGTEVKYHFDDPDNGAFIVDQSEGSGDHQHIFTLTGIPAGNYSKVQFGLGISPSAYLLGQSGQAKFWSAAQAKGLTWTWASGYIFVKCEGKYGATSLTSNFLHHAGNMGNPANMPPNIYKIINLTLPTNATVRTNLTPAIHVVADFNQYLSGQTPILLTAKNDNKMGNTGVLVDIMDNLSNMFSVDHVHNN